MFLLIWICVIFIFVLLSTFVASAWTNAAWSTSTFLLLILVHLNPLWPLLGPPQHCRLGKMVVLNTVYWLFDNVLVGPPHDYKTYHHNKETKLLSVNASLITDLPESPNRPIGLFGVLAIVTKVGFLVSGSISNWSTSGWTFWGRTTSAWSS